MIRFLPFGFACLTIALVLWTIRAADRRPQSLKNMALEVEFCENAEKIDQIEKTFDEVEAELFDHLNALEYRLPYEPPPEWPLLDCDHDWSSIASYDGWQAVFCNKCGIEAELPKQRKNPQAKPPRRPPGDDPRAGDPIRTYLG